MLQPFMWGQGGQQLTPGQVKILRELAAAKADHPTPKNLGEGLASVGDALLYNSNMAKANEAESAGQSQVAQALAEARAAGGTDGYYDVLGNPWATEGQQRVAGSLLDRGYALEDRQANWDHDASVRQDDRTYTEGAFDRGVDQRTELAGTLGLDDPASDRYIATGDFPAQQQPPTGYRSTADGGLEAIPGGPADVPKLNSTQQKELYDTDEATVAGQNVIVSLDQALQLNGEDKTDAGWGAKGRSGIGANLGDKRSANTLDLDNIVTGQALEALKATFGAAPTEGERKILLEIQGSVDQPREVREGIFKRAKAAAARRIEFNRQKAEAIRAGKYNDPGFAPPVFTDAALDTGSPKEPEGGVTVIDSQAEFDALPSGAVYIDQQDGKKYRKP